MMQTGRNTEDANEQQTRANSHDVTTRIIMALNHHAKRANISKHKQTA
jgi:hypothetical protein